MKFTVKDELQSPLKNYNTVTHLKTVCNNATTVLRIYYRITQYFSFKRMLKHNVNTQLFLQNAA